MPSNYRFLNTMGDEKIKAQNIADNKKTIQEIKTMTDDLVKDVKEIRNDIKDILELVKKKEQRDKSKWW